MKKTIIILLSLFLSHASINAQCIADAGNDTIIKCTLDSIPTILGGNPSASFGIPPYSYTWYISEPYNPVPGSTLIFYASHFLNDTTSPNPKIVNYCEAHSMKFFLKITDSLGCTSIDSCLVLSSMYNHHLGYWSVCIWKGDSVYLEKGSNLSGGIGQLTYLWRPNHGLADSTSLEFWAKPDSSIAYYVTVTDSVGCVGVASPLYFVQVLNVGIDEQTLDVSITITPNPSSGVFNISTTGIKDDFKIDVFDITGKLIHNKTIYNEKTIKLDLSLYPKGIYIIKLANKDFVKVEKVVLR